jgi:hypothetical protein
MGGRPDSREVPSKSNAPAFRDELVERVNEHTDQGAKITAAYAPLALVPIHVIGLPTPSAHLREAPGGMNLGPINVFGCVYDRKRLNFHISQNHASGSPPQSLLATSQDGLSVVNDSTHRNRPRAPHTPLPNSTRYRETALLYELMQH